MTDVPKHIEFILEYDRLFRSHLIYEAIGLESLLDKMIAWHFTADEAKHATMFSLVFREGEIGFATKINIVRKLIKKSYPDLKPSFDWVPKALDELRVLRNKFAHSELDLPDDPPPAESADGVTLNVLKDGAWTKEFVSRETVDAQMQKCRSIQLAAILLARLIEKRSRGTADSAEEAGFASAGLSLKAKVNKTG